MFKNVEGQHITVQLILRADGNDAGGALTPTVNVSKDGAAFGTGSGGTTHLGDGCYQYLLGTGESNADQVTFQFVEATVISQVLLIYPIDAALYKADVSGLMPTTHIDATGGIVDAVTAVGSVASPVATDTPSRDASKADVTNLDEAVSSRMPTTHIAATAGKVDGVATTDDVTNAVTTDTVSRDASKADVSNMLQKGVNYRYTNNASGAGTDDVTITDAP